MASAKNDLVMRFVTAFGVALITAAVTVGAFVSRMESKIERVESEARLGRSNMDLLHKARMDSQEDRIRALEALAKTDMEVKQRILQELTALKVSSEYQKQTLEELKSQIATLTGGKRQ